ncbi:MAG: 3-deoxy-7-phosphoheptulonate synthase [Chlamydiota bacterium]
MPFVPTSLNTSFSRPLLSPGEALKRYPSPFFSRDALPAALEGIDDRLIIVVGPCSLHDIDSSLEYARRLKKLSLAVEKEVLIVMRAFMEKPRSTIGWKGFVYDSSFEEGILNSRQLLSEIVSMGLFISTEFLQPLIAPYIADLISMGFIGARTSSSQIHREMASALPCPVGFKNSLDGNVSVAVHGALSARSAHSFMTIDTSGSAVEALSTGNPHSFIVLRGSLARPNYSPADCLKALDLLKKEGLPPQLFIDCSHGNSGKDYIKQKEVFTSCLSLKEHLPIRGLMLESHLESGNKTSITDSCLSFEETEELIYLAASCYHRSNQPTAFETCKQ